MPLELTVLIWVAAVCLTLITVLMAGFMAAIIVAALEIRALARAVGQEVAWIRARREQLWYRARFAGKWFKHMSRNISRINN